MTTDPHLDRLTPAERNIVNSALVRLEGEFVGVFNRETVERFLAESLDAFSSARVTAYVPVLAERFARDRLHSLAKAEGRLADARPAVLFVCVHNAGRSQMAAGWLRHLAGGRIDVYSGGSDPGPALNAAAVAAMAEVGIDISQEHPRPWADEIVQGADAVITMGCGDACPISPGKRYEDWELDDPAGLPLEAVRPIRDEIRRRVERLIAELVATPG